MCQSILLSFDLHLPLKLLLLELSQVFLAFSDLAAQLHGLIRATLIFKLGLIKLHEALIGNLGLTIGFLFGLVLSLQLLTLDGLEFINLTDHAVS